MLLLTRARAILDGRHPLDRAGSRRFWLKKPASRAAGILVRIGNIVGKSFGKPPVCHGDPKESVYPVTSGVPGCRFCKRSPLADDL